MWAVTAPLPSRLIRLLAAALALAASGHAAVWVAAGGDDRNAGTEEAPVRTLERARDLVRTQNRDMADDITVFLTGTFHLDQPVVFGPEDAGSNGFNVIYMPAPDAHPVVTGGDPITGWELKDQAANLWSAPTPAGLKDTHDLFVNGSPVRRTRGRLLQVFARAGADGGGAPASEPHWKNLGDVIFEPARPGAIWSERGGTPPFFVENAFEFLGTPGEWYFDRPGGRIYYTPRPGEDLATAEVVAAAAPALLVAAGTPEHPLAGLIFKGIRFEYTTQPDAFKEPGAAVRVSGATSVQFLEDEFVHLGTPGLQLGPGLDGGTVDGCLFGDIAWSAVQVTAANQVRVAESRISYASSRHGEAGAVAVSASTGVTVEHDQIDHFPRTAILHRSGTAADLTEEANQIAPPLLQLHGLPAFATTDAAEGELGVPPAYQFLLEQRLAAPTVPNPPDDVSAEAEDGFAYVTWIPTGLDGGSPVTGYVVSASNGAKANVSSNDFQGKGYMVFDNLENNHAVAFTVTAVNAQGAGPASLPTATVKPFRKRKLRPPPAPASVSVTPSGSGLQVRIVPAAADGGGPVVSYAVTSAPETVHNVLEGLDVVRADADHPVVRRVESFPPEHSESVSIAGTNAAGEGDALVVKLR